MTTITIPTADELTDRLNGIHRLLVVRRWERAAIVFAYTEVQTNRGHGTRPKPEPPKLNIRDFAAQGFAGLSTPKAVSRYREAWVTAIANGWATPVSPGQEVKLPTQEFPAWPYGQDSTWEDFARKGQGRGPTRPIQERIVGTLDRTASALRELAEAATEQPLDEEERASLVERLTTLRDEADGALKALIPHGEVVTV